MDGFMTKTVQDVLHKFYKSYDDATFDVDYMFHNVPTECGICPSQVAANVEVSSCNIISYENWDGDDTLIATAIFKLKTMKRETIFGTIFEKVYIFNNLVEEDDEYDQ